MTYTFHILRRNPRTGKDESEFKEVDTDAPEAWACDHMTPEKGVRQYGYWPKGVEP